MNGNRGNHCKYKKTKATPRVGSGHIDSSILENMERLGNWAKNETFSQVISAFL